MELRTAPYAHQLDEWTHSRDKPAHALFWEQGTGKSKLVIDTACWLWAKGSINGVLVVAPQGVHRNWVDSEIPVHSTDAAMAQTRAFAYHSSKASTKTHQADVKAILKHPGLSWLTTSYDAFVTLAAKKVLAEFLQTRRVLFVLDEAHSIKNPTAVRTKTVLKAAGLAPFRRILTGTPVAQGPFDVYSQVAFLDPNFWAQRGLGSFTAFRAHFGVFDKAYNPHLRRQLNPATGKWEACRGGRVDILVGYKRTEELHDMIAPVVSRVTKEEVLDLPPKVYERREFDLSPEQRRLYNEMREEAIAWLRSPDAKTELHALARSCTTCDGSGEINSDGYIYPCGSCSEAPDDGSAVAAPMALTRLLRLQQISCGYLPTGIESDPIHEIPGPQPRLEALLQILKERSAKTIVWARFQRDIDKIMEALSKREIRAVRYDGMTNDDERAEAKALFQGERPVYQNRQVVGREKVPAEEQAQVFVANSAVGATGLTLTAATRVVYYSNSFRLVDRLQSEDRCHRIGQTSEVVYYDLVARDSLDTHIIDALRKKFDIAGQITGDGLRAWL